MVKRFRIKFYLIIGILITLVLILYYVFSPFIDAYEVNKHLNMEDIKLLMTQEEVEKIWGKGDIENGFGGDFYRYDQRQVTIAYKYGGLLQKRVTLIYLSNPEYSIYNIHPGDTLEEAAAALGKFGFRQDKDSVSSFVKGNISISVSLNVVQINVFDWSTKGRVY